VEPSEIVAVGDDQNDVPMISGAGLGVAMGHAPPEVTAVADLVIGDRHGDSLAEFVEAYLL
jgi:hydroxymethylpyrimidine pyrophosphatase-like HAD family hydrolase